MTEDVQARVAELEAALRSSQEAIRDAHEVAVRKGVNTWWDPDGTMVAAGDLIAGHEYTIDLRTMTIKPTGRRTYPCPACGGDGIFSEVTGQDALTGAPISQEAECSCCRGTGEVEAEVEPIEMEDET